MQIECARRYSRHEHPLLRINTPVSHHWLSQPSEVRERWPGRFFNGEFFANPTPQRMNWLYLTRLPRKLGQSESDALASRQPR